MTERKPFNTGFVPWIEAQIRGAMEQGAFDNLPGAGKPSVTENLDPDWWVKQLMEREEVSVLPPSLELVRKVRNEIAALGKLGDEAAVRDKVAALNIEIAKFNATVVEGPPTNIGLLDADQVVARWQARAGNLGSSGSSA